MRGLTLAALCGVFLVGGLTAAPVPKEKPKEKTTEEKLAGKWKLVKSDLPLPPNFTFEIEYKPEGELSFIRNAGGRVLVSPGKYKVVTDEKLEWTVNEGGGERGETSKIKLSDNKLILEDPDGIKEEFERVIEKEAPKKD